MNYPKIYESLISNAQLEKRKKHTGIYYEKHHIIPRCLGGNDSRENLVLLTAKEHFIAHKLLLYINPDSIPLQRAFHMMCRSGNGEYKVSSRDYLFSRVLLSKIQSKERIGAGNPMYMREVSEETRKKISISSIGRKHSEEFKEKMRESKLGNKNPMYDKIFSDDHISKIKISSKGRKHSDESKEMMRIQKMGKKNPMYGKPGYWDGITRSEKTKQKISQSVQKIQKKECEYCHIMVAPCNYNRHVNKCKLKNN